MSYVGMVEHKGKKLTIVDISGCVPEESVMKIREGMNLVKSQQKSSVLLLTNVKDTVYHKDVFPILKDYAVANMPYIKASAVVGIDGMKKAILNTIRFITLHEICQFETIDEAEEWLASF